MAIGTTVKVGFDGSEVKKGFSGISGAFKSVGKGMAMGAGAMMSKSLIDLALKAITGIDQLADFAGEAQDTALQVGSTTSEIIKLDRALQLAGNEGLNAGNLLSKMTDSIYEASHGGTALQQTFDDLEFTMGDFVGKDAMQRFKMIGEAVAKIGENGGKTENALQEVFGNKMYKSMLTLFRNQDVFQQANSELGDFSKNVEKSADKIGAMQDQFQRIPYLWRSVNMLLFDTTHSFVNYTHYIKTALDAISAAIDSRDLGKVFYILKSELAKAIEVLADSDTGKAFSKFFHNIGATIGEGIKSAFGGGSMLDMINPFKSDKNKTSMIDPISEIQRTNSILERIYRTGGALYA